MKEKDQHELRAYLINSLRSQNDSDKAGHSNHKQRKPKAREENLKTKGTAKSNGDSKDQARKKRGRDEKNSYFTDGDRDEDDELEKQVSAAFTAYEQIQRDRSRKKNKKSAHVNDNEEDSSYVYVCKSLHPQELDWLEEQARQSYGLTSCVYSVVSSPRVPVIFDTGATVSTTSCREALTNVHRLKQPHRVGGVAAGVTVTAELPPSVERRQRLLLHKTQSSRGLLGQAER